MYKSIYCTIIIVSINIWLYVVLHKCKNSLQGLNCIVIVYNGKTRTETTCNVCKHHGKGKLE